MRTPLIISTLFAVSLFGSTALAEKPQPQRFNMPRNHGDTVDKNVRQMQKPNVTRDARQLQVRQAKNPVDKAASRINCSVDADCGNGAKAQRQSPADQATAGNRVDKSMRAPGILAKVLGSDRMQCNEAGESCAMNSAAVKREWASGSPAAAGNKAAFGAMGSNKQQMRERSDGQRAEGRMACNEADECSMNHKDVAKIWARESIKAGTFKPAEKPAMRPLDKVKLEKKDDNKKQ